MACRGPAPYWTRTVARKEKISPFFLYNILSLTLKRMQMLHKDL